MAGIFICYRREDSIAHTGRLHDHLERHFGPKHRVFMDIDSVEPGDDFVEAIQEMVASCDVFIAVIGRTWLTAMDKDGQCRIDQPEDFVRLEIEAALDRKIRVIPALVGGARMPRPQELPEVLSRLARRQAIEISDTSFSQSVTKLIGAMEKAISVAEEQRQISAKAMVDQAVRTAESPGPGTQKRNPEIQPRLSKDPIIHQVRLAAKSEEAEMIGTQRMYYFTVWIDAPMNILAMIESVQYDFIYDPNPLTIRSQEPGSKFSVRYHGWGCYDTVVVTLQPVDQDAQVQRRSFNMCSVI